MPLKPFNEDLQQALARQRDPQPPPDQGDDPLEDRLQPASQRAHRPATLATFEEDLDIAMLSQERPVKIDR